MSIDVLGTHIVILGSLGVVQDLFEKRGNIYSDRPPAPIANLIGCDGMLGMLPYGEKMKQARRMFTKALGTRALMEEFAPLMSQTVQDLVSNLVNCPERLTDHIRL